MKNLFQLKSSFAHVYAAILSISGAALAHADPLTWTGAGDGTTFGLASNWSPAVAPNTTSDCLIPSGDTPIAVRNNASIRSLSTARNIQIQDCSFITFRAGLALSGNAAVMVNNTNGCTPFVFQGGTQSISGTGSIVVTNLGSNGSVLTLDNNAAVSVGPGITLKYDPAPAGLSTGININSGCALINNGAIIFDRPSAQLTISGNGTFTNRGTLDIRSGTLAVYNLTEECGPLLLAPGSKAIVMGASFAISSPIEIADGASLQVDGTFTVDAPIATTDAELSLSGYWTNSSAISSLRSATTLTGHWSNEGTVQSDQSAITVGGFSPDLGIHQITGGQITYTEQLPDGITLTADASTSDIILDSVLLSNSTLRTLDGAKFLFQSTPYHLSPTTLTACKLDGDFEIDVCSLVRIDSGLALEDGTKVILRSGCLNGLHFQGPPQSITGSGEFIAIGPDSFTGGIYYMLTVQGELTMETGITFRVPPEALSPGTRKIVIESGRFINRGKVLMQAPEGDMAIVGGTLDNQGIIEATAGQMRIYPWYISNLKNNKLTGGTWRAINATMSFDQSTIQGIGPGADITLQGPLGTIPQFANISSNAGALHVRGRAQTIAPVAPGLFTNTGTLDLASDASLTVTGGVALSSMGTLRTEVAGLNTGQVGKVTATGPVTLAGKLQGAFASAYAPMNGDITSPVIQSPQIGGAFSSHCFDDHPSALGVMPYFDVGPPNTISLEVSHSAGIPPMILHGPADTSANPNVMFHVDAWPTTLTFEWKRDGIVLADGPTPSGAIISGATTSELTIYQAKPADVGQYTVTASTPCSSVTSDPAWLRYCHGDFNSDLAVDDSDFLYFVVSYNVLDCADPAMPHNCPGDFNADGVVDDVDFQTFVAAYDSLVCPQLSVCSCNTPNPPGPHCIQIPCN